LATIADTVELTSNPAPLVGDPKLIPTVPIDHSLAKTQAARYPLAPEQDWKQFIETNKFSMPYTRRAPWNGRPSGYRHVSGLLDSCNEHTMQGVHLTAAAW
jgi:hypothetical protein